jgi:hypothetical protein
MLFFVLGAIAGVALGMIVIGFLAVDAYDRGYEDAMRRRKVWQAELVARRAARAEPLAPTARRAS